MSKKITYIALLLGVIVASCGSGKELADNGGNESDADKISKADHPYIQTFHEGLRLKTQGRVDEAASKMEQCLLVKQDDDAVYYALSQLELMRGDETKSAQYIQRAADIDPNNIWYTQELAYMFFEREDYKSSVVNFKKLVEKEPKNVDWLYAYSEALARSGDLEGAVGALDKTEEQMGVNPQVSLQKYQLYMMAKKPSEALQELEDAQKEFPQNPQIIATMVDHYFQQGKQAEGIEMLKQLVKADPTNGRARLVLADVYKRQGDDGAMYQELEKAFDAPDVDLDSKMRILINIHESSFKIDPKAFALAEKMVQQYPEEAKSHSIYGDYLYSSEREAEALKAYQKALEYDKSEYPIWNQVLIMEYQQGEFEDLYRDSKAAMDLYPTITTVYLLNGVAANQTKRYDTAVESLSAGRELVIGDKALEAEFFGQLGEAQFGLRNVTDGKKSYKKAMELDPNSSLIKNNFAYRLGTHKTDFELAESLIRQALDAATDQPQFLDTYGWILFQQGKYDDAKKKLEKALNGDKDNAAILDHLGDVYFKLGDVNKALDFWKEAQKLDANNDVLNKKIKDKKYYEPIL